MKPRPTVVGLDLSLTSTGISVGDQWAFKSKKKGCERLMEIREAILGTVAKAGACVVCVEGYSFASMNSQAHSAGELGGVVRVALYEAGVPYVDVPPTSLKKFATGRGNASKGEVMSAVSARTGLVWAGAGADDMCDAWVLEEIGRECLGFPRWEWPKLNKEALKGVDFASWGEYLPEYLGFPLKKKSPKGG